MKQNFCNFRKGRRPQEFPFHVIMHLEFLEHISIKWYFECKKLNFFFQFWELVSQGCNVSVVMVVASSFNGFEKPNGDKIGLFHLTNLWSLSLIKASHVRFNMRKNTYLRNMESNILLKTKLNRRCDSVYLMVYLAIWLSARNLQNPYCYS